MYDIIDAMVSVLPEPERSWVTNRVASRMPDILTKYPNETARLAAIGREVDAAIDDFRPAYASVLDTAQPSVLPEPNQETLHFLAKIEAKMREANMPEEKIQAALSKTRIGALKQQQEERGN